MDTTTSQSALDALRTAEFRLSLRGYDVDEVDDFLERAAVEADALREQLRQLTSQLDRAAERAGTPTPAPAATPPVDVTAAAEAPQTVDSVTRMLEMAERFIDQTKREAEAEAAAMLTDAQDRAKQLATDAQQQLSDEVARLEGLRQRLGEDVEKLTVILETERNRITGNLHDLLSAVDRHLQPPAPLDALRTTAANVDTVAHSIVNGPSEGGAQVLLLDDARGDEG